MPRFRISSNKKLQNPLLISLKAIVHKSGRISLMNSEIKNATIEVKKADGNIDEIMEEVNIGSYTKDRAEKLMSEPQKINIKAFKKSLNKGDII